MHDQYCHRKKKELSPEGLQLLTDSIKLEGGIRVPITIYTNSKGQIVVICGHRRVGALQTLADRKEPGFSHDMEIDAIEIVNGTEQDYVTESVTSNESQLKLSQIERLRALKKLDEAGVKGPRAARALGVSKPTYYSDLRVVENPWAYDLVVDESLALSDASKLIKEAKEKERLDELQAHVEGWIAKTKQEQPDKSVTISKALVEHWLRCLTATSKLPLDDTIDNSNKWGIKAHIDQNRLEVHPITMDLTKASAEELAILVGQFSQLGKQLTPYAQQKVQIERCREQIDPAPLDFEHLRQHGLAEYADKLEQEYRREQTEPKNGNKASGQSQDGQAKVGPQAESPDNKPAEKASQPSQKPDKKKNGGQ
jgi:ParB-like chromosome segregation protein Spo0J